MSLRQDVEKLAQDLFAISPIQWRGIEYAEGCENTADDIAVKLQAILDAHPEGEAK